MTSQAKMATGMFLAFNGYVLAEMTDISEPPLAVEKVDSTSHDSPCKITIPGQLSYGDMTYTVNFVNDVTQAALETMATARTTGMWQVIFPPAFASLSYQVPGFVSGIKKKTPLKSNPASRDFTVTPTGGITPITTAGPTLTTPYMVVEDQVPNIFALSPALSGTTYQYTCTSKQASTSIYCHANGSDRHDLRGRKPDSNRSGKYCDPVYPCTVPDRFYSYGLRARHRYQCHAFRV